MALAGKPLKWIKAYGLLLSMAILVIICDQITKALIEEWLKPGQIYTVIPGFFDIISIRNRGAAFGFLNRSDIEWQFWLFLAATLVAVWAIFTLARQGKSQPLLNAALGLVLGGAIGNLIDRVRHRAVVDFLDFYWQQWHWPAFNIADIGICIGVFLACLATWQKKPGAAAK